MIRWLAPVKSRREVCNYASKHLAFKQHDRNRALSRTWQITGARNRPRFLLTSQSYRQPCCIFNAKTIFLIFLKMKDLKIIEFTFSRPHRIAYIPCFSCTPFDVQFISDTAIAYQQFRLPVFIPRRTAGAAQNMKCGTLSNVPGGCMSKKIQPITNARLNPFKPQERRSLVSNGPACCDRVHLLVPASQP